MPTKPEILKIETLVHSRLFAVEQVDLRFSNGELRTYERLRKPRTPAVMIVPMLDAETVLLIKEYSVGTEDYQLTLPKGAFDPGETLMEAANRELMEEVGFGAHDFIELKPLTLSPAYMGHTIHIVLAENLFPQRLQGDEPEQLEVVPHKIENMAALLADPHCTESRAIAALYMVRDLLRERQTSE